MTSTEPSARPAHPQPAPASGSQAHRCGHAAIVGRPNVGKSTLLNRLVGQKLSITSRKAQTTRHRIAGILTRPDAQLIFIDSPGHQARAGGALDRLLNRTARQVAADADVVVLVCDGLGWTPADAQMATLLPRDRPTILAVNKVDAARDRARLASLLREASGVRPFDEIVPLSARTGHQVGLLADLCAARLPAGPALFEADALTDRGERFFAAEIIREKLFRLLGDELPYESTVLVDQFEELPRLRRIHATIVVAREAHRPIVLGAGGERIRRIATEARQDLERMLDTKIYLELFVKVRGGWADDEASLRAFGYD
jgi:GTP-binding protein Era